MSNEYKAKELIEIQVEYGVDPQSMGNRYRRHWIAVEGENERYPAGTLVVRSRDGSSNPICIDTIKIDNCFDTFEDNFDPTYRYYLFRPLIA